MSVEVADHPGFRVRLCGLRLAVNPLGDADAERLIVPEKPARLLTVMMVVAELPACTVAVVGFDDMVKSPTPTVIVVM